MSGYLCARGTTPSVPSFFGRVRKPEAKDGPVRVTPSSPSGHSKPSRDLLGEPNKVLRVNRGDAEDAQPDAGLHEVARKGLAPPMALIQRSYMSNPPARKAAPCAATAGFG